MGWDILVEWIFDITVIHWNGWWWYFVLSASLNWKKVMCVACLEDLCKLRKWKCPSHSSRIAFNTSCTDASNFFNQVHQHKIKHPMIHFSFNFKIGIKVQMFFCFFYSHHGTRNKKLWLHFFFLLHSFNLTSWICGAPVQPIQILGCKPSHSGVWAEAAFLDKYTYKEFHLWFFHYFQCTGIDIKHQRTRTTKLFK